MQRMSPPPRYIIQTVFGSLAVPYALSPFVAYFSVPLHCVKNPQFRTNFALIREEYFGRLGSAAKQLFQWAFSRTKPFIEYPVGGTLELMDCIMEKLRACSVEIRLNSRVEAIERLDDGTLRVSWAGVESIVPSVSMTRHQNIARFTARGRDVKVDYLPFTYTPVHFMVTTSRPLRAAFMMAKRDPIVNLVSDLTAYTPGLPEGKRLVVVRLHRAGAKDAREAAEVFAHLKKGGYLPDDSTMDGFEFSTYDQGRMTTESLADIASAFGDTLRVFRSTNFSNSIGEEVARWRE